MYRSHIICRRYLRKLRLVATHNERRSYNKIRNGVPVAGVTALFASLLLLSEDDHHSIQASNDKFLLPLLASSVAYCDDANKQPSNASSSSTVAGLFGFLQRTKSTDRIRNLADARNLDIVYDVNWDTPLGEGGFGAVYEGIEKITQEQVAVKKISKDFTNNEGFHREMQAFLQIRSNGGHPNICGLHDYFESIESGDYFLALDLISGGEMFDHLMNNGAYSEADAARFIQEIARALDFLHGIGIVHGDLKPENLMLSTEQTSDAVVKVIDFGTAQVLDDSGHPMVALGGGRTEAYCPPEVLKQLRPARLFGPGRHRRGAMRVDPSMDMWALGIILYVMLVGAHPYDLYGTSTDQEIIQKVVGGEKPPLDDDFEHTSHLSKASKEVIRKLLTYHSEDRITAHELLKEPWVQGITASTEKMDEIDQKLKGFRKIKTKLEVKVFEDMFNWSTEDGQLADASSKMSLIERSFRNLDTEHKGFITAKDMEGNKDIGTSNNGEDSDEESLSLSGFASLLSDSMQNEYYMKGDVIYREGDKGHDMLFINSGVVEVTSKAGFKTTLKQGDFVGEGSLISDKPRSGTVKCKTPVHAIKITKEYFDKYLSTSESGLSLKMIEKDKDRENSRIIFSAFSEMLSENMKNETFDEGAIVYREGDEGDDIFFINSGVVEVSNKDGFRATLKQGDFVGEGALLSNKPRSGTVKCLTPVEGMKITKEYFDKYLASSDSAIRMRETCRDRNISRTKRFLRKNSFVKNSNTLTFAGGDSIYKEGDLKKSLYIVDDGIVELVVGGHPVLKLKPGDICGEHSIIFNRPRNASANCVTRQCKVIELPSIEVAKLFGDSPSLIDAIKESSLRSDFQKAVVYKTRKEFPKTLQALQTAFQAVTHPTGGNEITLPMMTSLLRNVNPEIQDADIKAVFDSIDMNRKGSIDFATFKLIFGVE